MVTICQIDLNGLTSTVLRETANTIVYPGVWVQGDGAFDAQGRRVLPTDPDAVCWSVAAALQKAATELFFEAATEREIDLESTEMEVRRLEKELLEAKENVNQASIVPSPVGSCDEEHVPLPDEIDDWEPGDFFQGEPDFDAYVEILEDASIALQEATENAARLEAELEEAKESVHEARSNIEAYNKSKHTAENELVEAALAAVEGYLGGITLNEIAKIDGPEDDPWHASVELDARAVALANILRATADRVDAAHEG